MEVQEPIDNETGEEQVPSVNEQDDPKALRQTVERTLEENKLLRSQLKSQAFQLAGIDPEQGVGKLMYRTYDGEATAEAVANFAEEYGITATSSPKEEGSQSDSGPTTEEAGRKVEQVDRRVEAIMDNSREVEAPSDLSSQIQQAEAEGDWDRAMELKSRLVNPLATRRG